MDKTTCTLVALVLCLAMTASSDLISDDEMGGLVIAGEPISIKDVPWQVSLVNGKGIHFCGGAIISERFIVTSAYCLGFKQPEDIQVRSGSASRNKGGVLTNVATIILHKNYGSGKPTSDIALIGLSEPLKFGPSAGAIDLAKQGEPLFGGELVQVTGWAYTSVVGVISDVLLEASLPVLDEDKCEGIYHDTNVFCAGNSDVHLSSCNGESGGPAVLNGVLVGIVWGGQGHPCPKPELTATVTLIRNFRDWIDSHAV